MGWFTSSTTADKPSDAQQSSAAGPTDHLKAPTYDPEVDRAAADSLPPLRPFSPTSSAQPPPEREPEPQPRIPPPAGPDEAPAPADPNYLTNLAVKREISDAALENCADIEYALQQCYDNGSFWHRMVTGCSEESSRWHRCVKNNKTALAEFGYAYPGNTELQNFKIKMTADKYARELEEKKAKEEVDAAKKDNA